VGLSPAQVDLTLPPIEIGVLGELPVELQRGARKLGEEAEQVLAHRVDLLGSGLIDLGPEIDWHRDFKSGYRWPQRFYSEVEVTRLGDRSDAKVPWELSRCHHLLTLARAARLFERERYALELESQLESWLDANPPGIGINWTNAMEVGIRAVNIAWALATLERWRPLEPVLRRRVVDSLRWHGHHIEANLEGTPYLRSNHYLGDILGLLVLGATLSGEPAAAKWCRYASRAFEREIQKQVCVDGVSFEASLAYHGLVFEMFLVASYIAAWAGAPFSKAFLERLRLMGTVSRTARHRNGRIPLFGDQDSGRILPAGFARPPTHDNLLWLAAALDRQTRPIDSEVDAEVAWIFGVQAWKRCKSLPFAPSAGSAAFPQGGIFVLHTDRAHVVVRCGDVGQDGFGGHAHNDLLSFELSVDDVPLIVDAGTYAYTFDVDARNQFRSTASHNTIRIDETEINPIDPEHVFELRQFARHHVEALQPSSDPMVLTCSHDGYRRLEPPCEHKRHFSLAAGSGELSTRDELLGSGSHRVESFVHLAPQSSLRRIGETSLEVSRGRARARIAFSGMEARELSIEDGWVSEKYGAREQAPLLVARALRAFPCTLGYTVTPL
jgi:Heparinase II/III-like protein/Heparinase II/III N-terminus